MALILHLVLMNMSDSPKERGHPFLKINTFLVLYHKVYIVYCLCFYGESLMLTKKLKGRINLVREKHTDKVGERRAYTIEICTGFLKLSMITFSVSFHGWKKREG